jgi:AcrR family transcriptional regulator
MGARSRSDEVMQDRVLDAALRCVGRWGVAKTTLDDVAREAGCGRATIYRTFDGGKAAVLRATALREIARGEATIDAALAGVDDLEDLLVAGTLAASRAIRGHDAFQFLLAHEPDVVLPFMSFDRLDLFWREAARYSTPHLARFVAADDAPRAAEWVVRVILSYTLNPSEHIDPTVEVDARRLVRTYLLPALERTVRPTAPLRAPIRS